MSKTPRTKVLGVLPWDMDTPLWTRPVGVRVQKVQRVHRVQRGEILAALCFEMLMRTNAERRANFPLRGKWCAAPIGVHFHRAKPGCLVFSGIRENRKMKRSNSCTYLFRDSPFGGWRHHLSPRESMSLDSQSPKGSLRIQFLCHPASGGTIK